MPKQLLPIAGAQTMLQETALRVGDRARFRAPIVVTAADHRFIIADQMREIGVADALIVLEPEGRNTAPAIAAAALVALKADPEALILVMPADHVILNSEDLVEAARRVGPAAAEGRSVLFGIRPTSPATGYGYILPGAPLEGVAGARHVSRFVEKPDAATAARYVEEGYLWNGGIFLLSAKGFLAELEALEPAIAANVRDAVASAAADPDFVRLDPASFLRSPSISIDNAVMERSDRAVVADVDLRWSDVGSWSTLWELGERDADGNVLVGQSIAEGSTNSYLRSEGPVVAVVGVSDLVVVATADAVLVTTSAADQNVKTVVDRMRLAGWPAATDHPRVNRPWGHFETLALGDGFQVKRIAVKPGQKLSLQKHAQRSEHWVVVSGTARVTVGEEVTDLTANQSAYIPLGATHRLENPGPTLLQVIEVQSGRYLGEDDIVRLEDMYARD
jgi:mannose-1-phosphate guanylyltransferase/mannose-1-phosphate guanylyltransferase/mannose-6-phosphate isomerase